MLNIVFLQYFWQSSHKCPSHSYFAQTKNLTDYVKTKVCRHTWWNLFAWFKVTRSVCNSVFYWSSLRLDEEINTQWQLPSSLSVFTKYQEESEDCKKTLLLIRWKPSGSKVLHSIPRPQCHKTVTREKSLSCHLN